MEFREVIATYTSSHESNILDNLLIRLKKRFGLSEDELDLVTGHTDRLYLCGPLSMGRPTDRIIRMLPLVHAYCEGYLDGMPND